MSFFPPCIRFYFRNWHGNTEGESSVWRHCISKLRGSLSLEKMPEGTPLLDAASLDYLFYQVIIHHLAFPKKNLCGCNEITQRYLQMQLELY